MHLKRQKIPKKWPVPRKGTTYVVRPSFSLKNGIPILVILRDILKLAQNKKEVKRAIHEKNILLNNKPIINEKHSVLLFDIITIVPSKINYKIELSENGKFKLNEVKGNEARKKISKIINKKILKGKKEQLNLMDGRNFISKIKCNMGDSILMDFEKKNAEKCIPLKEKSNVIVFEGKHAGKKGIVNKLNKERKMAELNIQKEKINVLIKQLMAIE